MSTSSDHRTLSERDREILKDVILMHTLSAEPVSSRALSKLGRHNLSSASLRNVMADLEESGYLRQPHTSAGRVPTRAGYHLFVGSLMDRRQVSAEERRYIKENLKAGEGDPEGLMEASSHLLSELSQQVSIVVSPMLGESVLEGIEFVPLTGTRVLCVVVSESGFIDNKVVDSGRPIPREKLVEASNYLTENFRGRSIRQIRDRLLTLMDEERSQVDDLLRMTLDLARAGLREDDRQGVFVDGTATVLGQPELADVQRVRRLFETFADRAGLVRMLNQCLEGGGLRVLIGDDSDLTSELGFSLVATQYGIGERTLGSLGIFGPSRMEYDRVIPLVHFLGKTLSEALTESAS